MSISLKQAIPWVTLGVSMLGSLGSFTSPASAKTLVTCGPNGAAYIVEIVPAGCRVLAANSPPQQAGNSVEESRLGFYFNASAPTDIKLGKVAARATLPQPNEGASLR